MSAESFVRVLTSRLAEDLDWLEMHCRRSADQAQAAGKLRLAAATVRNTVGPYLDGQPPVPLHIAVVGGAGAGKSTIANLLSGAQAAEANPQAGFTRHPIAYTGVNGALNWTGYVGFLGNLQLRTEPGPASLDEDVYQVRRVPNDPSTWDLVKDFVVWDCPDMTTWASTGYVPRLLETCALADILVYVASDERYNDEVPTQFLRLLLQTGKPVVVVLTKMRPEDAEPLVAHFRQEVVAALPPGVVGVVAIPYLTPDELADPARKAARFRIPLINQVAVLGGAARQARERTVLGGMNYLLRGREQILAFARADLAALQHWQTIVQRGQQEFEDRYTREYLSSEKFRGFDEALVRLMELLELPGIGKYVSGALYVIRTPYRLLKGLVAQAITRPESQRRPEQPVLEDGLAAWIDLLRKEAARNVHHHALWGHISQGFQDGKLTTMTHQHFAGLYRNFQLGLADEVDRTARSIYDQLKAKPWMLNSLRGTKFAIDAGSIALAVAAGGINWWDILWVPLAASLSHQLVELLGRSVIDSQREQTRLRQQKLMHDQLAVPMAAWLNEWPATGGSAFERLQLALRRIPEDVQTLDEQVRAKYESSKG